MLRHNSDGLSACIIKAVLDDGTAGQSYASLLLDLFLEDADLQRALVYWFGEDYVSQPDLKDEQIRAVLSACIAQIDDWMNGQLNQVLHAPRVQQIEASWRGLLSLVATTPEDAAVKIRVLDVTWKELADDANRAIEFDQSQFFQKVYEDEFGKPGGQPYGLVLADYQISHRVECGEGIDDVGLIQSLAVTAATAFSPLVIGADATLFGADSFEALDRRLNLERLFAQHEYIKWRSFTESEDSRYVGVVVPRVLMRTPYRNCTSRTDFFPFEEQVNGPDNSRYLWGSAVYSMGAVAVRAFCSSGWLEDLVGASRDSGRNGGYVSHLPIQSFATDHEGVIPKFSTEVLLTDEMDREFAGHGFTSLCHCKYTNFPAFQSIPSVHRIQTYDNAAATRNEELSSKLNLMMCIARFAHYIKVIVRDHTGRFHSPRLLESHLHDWIHKYVSADSNIAANARTKYPLREASIRIRESLEQPGTYICIAHLRPHLRADRAAAAVKMVTQLPTGTQAAGAA